MSHLLGIDYGTSAFKIHLYDLNGNPLLMRGGQIPLQHSSPGWIEQDSEQGWQKISATIRQMLIQAEIDPASILAIGTTGTTNINLLDHSGHPLRLAILYGDKRLPPDRNLKWIRSNIAAQDIGKPFGFDSLDDATWTLLLRLLAGSKLLWLNEYEAETIAAARACVTSSWDYVNVRLTGVVAHWEGALDADRRLLEPLDLPEGFFGKACRAGEIVGHVTDQASVASGLAGGTPVVMGVTDSLCSFLGAGITEPGMALNTSGTTDVIAVSSRSEPKTDVGYPVQHLLPDLWLLSLSPVRGPTVKWFLESFLPPGSTYADLDRLAAQAPPGSDGLVCLPYFAGEKGFVHDPRARGVLAGFDLHHDTSHMVRACLEGIALSLRQILNAYREQGLDWNELRLCGGGAASDLWNQIKADVLGIEVRVLRVLETGCLGAAILAATAVGVFDDLAEASDSLVTVHRVIEPVIEYRERYDALYQAFQKLYPATVPSLKFLEPTPIKQS